MNGMSFVAGATGVLLVAYVVLITVGIAGAVCSIIGLFSRFSQFAHLLLVQLRTTERLTIWEVRRPLSRRVALIP